MRSEEDVLLAGKLYYSPEPTLVKLRNRAKELCYQYNITAPSQQAQRDEILNQLIDCPTKDAYIELPTRMDIGSHIHVGKHFYANYDCFFLDDGLIRIGDNVMLGPRVSLYTAGHPIDAAIRNEDLEYGRPITIGSDVWIGGNAVILPGVTIGSNVVIGAGSIVTKDIPDDVIVAGNPARILRAITAEDTHKWQLEKDHYLAEKQAD